MFTKLSAEFLGDVLASFRGLRQCGAGSCLSGCGDWVAAGRFFGIWV